MEDHGQGGGHADSRHGGKDITWAQELGEALLKIGVGFVFAGILLLALGLGLNQTDKWMVLGIGIAAALWVYPHLEKALKAGA